MTSNIDPSLPGEGKAYTADVRNNFAAAKNEIEELQNAVVPSAAAIMNNPSDPVGTTSITYRMMGLAVTLTPTHAGKILITVDGKIQNSSQNQSTSTVICFGTGTPPVNSAIQTGTIVGAPASFEAASNSSPFAPFSLTVLASNVIAGITYWFDLAVRVTGGTGIVSDLNITAVEIL